jgi:hypothetical protein
VALGFCSCAVIQWSLNKADNCRCLSDSWGKKIKLKEEAISEILVPVTHSNQVLKAQKMFTLASEITYPTALLSGLFSRGEKGKSV